MVTPGVEHGVKKKSQTNNFFSIFPVLRESAFEQGRGRGEVGGGGGEGRGGEVWTVLASSPWLSLQRATRSKSKGNLWKSEEKRWKSLKT